MTKHRFIASEQQAEEIGRREFGEGFTVFWYVQRPSNLTLFGVSDGTRSITTFNPHAAVSA